MYWVLDFLEGGQDVVSCTSVAAMFPWLSEYITEIWSLDSTSTSYVVVDWF